MTTTTQNYITAYPDLVTPEIPIATANYQNLPGPKTCSIDLYIELWLRDVVDLHLKKMNSQPFDIKGQIQDEFPRAIAAFLNEFPYEKSLKLSRQYAMTPIPERQKLVKSWQLDFSHLESLFVDTIKARNHLALSQNFPDFLTQSLSNLNIPPQSYQAFSSQLNEFIIACQKQLPPLQLPETFYSLFHTHCYVCLLDNFPFSNIKEVKNVVYRKFPILQKFENKITIQKGDTSHTTFSVKEDKFIIELDQHINSIHKSLDLIHEYSHVISYLEWFAQNVDPANLGRDLREVKAIQNQLSILQEYPPLFHSFFGEILHSLRRSLFEIEIYQSLNPIPSQVFGETLAHCIPGADSSPNYLYLLDSAFLLKPFRYLPHSMAYFQILHS
jgi:hypothetical protein